MQAMRHIRITAQAHLYTRFFRDFAVYFGQCGMGMKLINQVCSLGVYVPRHGYPSWAPWFSEMIPSNYSLNVDKFHTAGNSKTRLTLASDSESLVSSGALIYKVKVVGPQGHPLSEDKSFTLEQFITWIFPSAQILRNQTHIFEVGNALLDSMNVLNGIPDVMETLCPLLRRGDQGDADLGFDGSLVNSMVDIIGSIHYLPK